MQVTYASAGIALAMFIAICVYHFMIKLNQSRNGKLLVTFMRKKFRRVQIEEDEVVMIPTEEARSQVTYSEVNLENTNSL